MNQFEVDEVSQLRSVEAALVEKFPAIPAERVAAEIDRALHSYDGAKIRNFVPVLVQHEVTDTLRHTASV